MVRARPRKNHGKKAVKQPEKTVLQFYTKFLGYGPEFNLWLKEEDFTNDGKCRNPILQSYMNKVVNKDQTCNPNKTALSRGKKRIAALLESNANLREQIAKLARVAH